MALQKRTTRTGTVRWVARWRDKGGKEHSRSFDKQKQAKVFLAEIETKAARGADTAPGTHTVRSLFDAWLATRDIRESTRTGYEYVRDTHLVPLHNYPAAELTAADVLDWTRQLRHGRPWISRTDTGIAESTVHTTLVVFASAYKWGVQEGHVARSPVHVPRQELAIDPVTIPTRAEIERVIAAVAAGGAPYTAKGRDLTARPNPAIAAMMQIGLWAGLRVSEIGGLTVGDVDLDAGLIHVRAQLAKDAPRRVPLKSRTSRRDVPIAAELLPLLRLLTAGRAPSDWLIVSRNGRPIQASHAAKVIKPAAAYAGAPGVHMHALRHFFVSSLLTAGVPVQDVAAVAGHTPTTTLETYAHVLAGHEHRVAAAFDSPAFTSRGISAGSPRLQIVE